MDDAFHNALISLRAGELAVELAPGIGGCVASFRLRGDRGVVDLMRPMADEARHGGDVTGATMFPMVPYANRIAGDQFDFEGRTYRFKKRRAGGSSSIHGSGWRSEWAVSDAGTQSAELRFDQVRDDDDPYSYSAFQRFCLSDECLSVTIGVTNRGAERLPFGFGLHPFWSREPDVKVAFRSTHFWLEGPDHIPTDRIATPCDHDFSRPQSLPLRWRNNCYSGWDGYAEILRPIMRTGLRIRGGALFRHLTLYCDPAETFFCLEPQTHAVGAFNRIDQNNEEDLGVLALEPGRSSEETVSFTPFSI